MPFFLIKAVKIAPNYYTEEHFVVHVIHISCSVTVVALLLNENEEDFIEDLTEEYDEVSSVLLIQNPSSKRGNYAAVIQTVGTQRLQC